MREYLVTVSRPTAESWWIAFGLEGSDKRETGCFQSNSLERLKNSLELLKFDTNEIAQLSRIQVGAVSYKAMKRFPPDALAQARDGSQPCI